MGQLIKAVDDEMTGKNIEGHNKTKHRKSKVRNPSDGYNGGLCWRFSIIESGRAKLDQSAPPGGGLHNNGAFRANSNARILSVIHSNTFEGVLRFIAGHSDVIPSIPFYELFFFTATRTRGTVFYWHRLSSSILCSSGFVGSPPSIGMNGGRVKCLVFR